MFMTISIDSDIDGHAHDYIFCFRLGLRAATFLHGTVEYLSDRKNILENVI